MNGHMPPNKSPYKDIQEFRRELSGFLKSFRSTLRQEVSRANQFFEMACLAYCAQYYRNRGFKVIERNIFGSNREFRFKLGPAGYPENFSYFELEPSVESPDAIRFEIRHNCLIQIAFDSDIFLCPDICVINLGCIEEQAESGRPIARGKKTYFVPNRALQTFIEAKHFNPIPELLASFIGLLHELKQDVFSGAIATKRPHHIAPSLAVSGFGTWRVYLLKESLCRRFRINIFLGMFYWKHQMYAKKYSPRISTVGTTGIDERSIS
jgi:hypothetical protein